MEALQQCPNVYFDTSSTLDFVPGGGSHGICSMPSASKSSVGRDFPMWDHKEELARFLALPLTEDERNRIFHGTFEEIFSL